MSEHFCAELQALFLKEKTPKLLSDFCVKMGVEEIVDLAMLAPCDAEVQTLILEPAGIGVGPEATRARRVWYKARLVYEATLRGAVGKENPESAGSSLPGRGARGENDENDESKASSEDLEVQDSDAAQSDSEGSCTSDGVLAGETAGRGEGARGWAESESPTFDQEEQESESTEDEDDEVAEVESVQFVPPWRKRRAVVVLKPNKRWRRG